MDSSSVEQYKSSLERFSESLLRPYINWVQDTGKTFSERKEINDPIWETIVLHPLEIALLDSPLIQRLRHIRQLGVAHWTYPGAVHTRLEHTLGVVHQIQVLVDSLNSTAESVPRIGDEWANLLRLAALCHDVGHGFMSHVSENALYRLGLIQTLSQDISAELDVVSRQRKWDT